MLPGLKRGYALAGVTTFAVDLAVLYILVTGSDPDDNWVLGEMTSLSVMHVYVHVQNTAVIWAT